MIETQLNLFDATVIAVMVLSCLFAFFRGFVREILSLSAWIGAGIITLYYFPHAAEIFKPYFKNPTAASGVGTLAVYIGALFGLSLLNMLILKFVKSGSDVGMLDNMLGLIFGFLRGAFILSLGYLVITVAMPEKERPDWLKEAKTRIYVEKGSMILTRLAPQYINEIKELQENANNRKDDELDIRDDLGSHDNYRKYDQEYIRKMIGDTGDTQ
ncbi:MAG: CvpA family protein [Rickettsiales bacterium]|nr:CvpA family protein [Rickettsiales bacterium]